MQYIEEEEDSNFFIKVASFIFYNAALILAYIPALVMDMLLTPLVLLIYGKFIFGFIRGIWKYQKDFNSESLDGMWMSSEERARHSFKTI